MSSWLGVATATTRSPPVQLDPVLALERYANLHNYTLDLIIFYWLNLMG
jgi:hypothetical protein